MNLRIPAISIWDQIKELLKTIGRGLWNLHGATLRSLPDMNGPRIGIELQPQGSLLSGNGERQEDFPQDSRRSDSLNAGGDEAIPSRSNSASDHDNGQAPDYDNPAKETVPPVEPICSIRQLDDKRYQVCGDSPFRILKWYQPEFRAADGNDISQFFSCDVSSSPDDNTATFEWKQEFIGRYIMTVKADVEFLPARPDRKGKVVQVSKSIVLMNGSVDSIRRTDE